MVVATPPTRWAEGLVLVVIGEAIRLWAVGYIGRISRTTGDNVGQLVAVGPYTWVRNPLYVGNILLYAGFGVICWPWVFILVPLLLAYYQCIVTWEEWNLTRQLGSSYEKYLATVPRWVPRWSRVTVTPTPLSWRLGEALRSERSTLLALFAILGVMFLRGLG